MDKQSAVKLLNETFKRDFDINCYISFIKELFNHFDIKLKEYQPETQYNEYIDRYCSLGHFTDASRKIIEILTVKLKRTSSRDRARTMQRNFVAQYLRTYGKHAALVAFYGDDEDWRFSFVKMEYTLVQDEKGKVKPEEELTPAKRYSFLVGKNEPNHTCEQQFIGLLMEDKKDPLIDEIENAFSIEKVSKVFFEEYKKLYWALEDSLREIISKDSIISAEFEDKNISTVDFSKKLLGQIVFIYFLQKKGWLGVKVNEQWGTGPRDFLRRLFGDSKRGIKPLVPYNNFFNDILEPLFYEALATDRAADNHYYRLFNCKIPFLNGGLFEPINEYDWTGTEIKLDDTIFEGIFDTFDRFNFTVKEDEPLEKEVAVDPEMLGKVFENLLEVKDRKSKGAFYTPREIVHYMCQQSLINYIETNTTILREDIEKFVQRGDLALDQIIKAQAQKTKYQGKLFGVDTKALLPKSIEDNYEVLDKLLKEIKVVDPAVGSGAFPVGMLNEIVKARSILSVFFKEERKNYDLKREIIENCLYGVDIEPSAVEIAKLRFWLSLIVDEDNIENIKPLPNLDHKIMCGNSLLEEFILDESKRVKLFDEKLLGQVPKDNSIEIKQIDDKIAALNKEKGEIARGKKGRSIKDVEREIKRLEAKKERIREGKDDSERNSTLDESFRIKESQKKLAELKRMQKEYFNEQNRGLKKQLREKIDKIEWELIKETLKEQGNSEAMQKLEQYRKNKAKPFFLWKLYFAEVFQRENPGFDVVIGNPPYGFRDVLTPEEKEYFRKVEKIEFSSGDSAELFCKKCFDKLIRTQGVLSFIIPKKSLYGDSWESLRVDYWKKYNLLFILDSSKAFDKVLLEASAFGLQKSNQQGFKVKLSYLTKEDNIKHFAFVDKCEIITENNTAQIYFSRYPKSIVHKIKSQKINESLISGNLGLAIGRPFYSDEKTAYKLLKGIDVERWRIKSHRYLKNKDKLNWFHARQFLKPKVIAQRIVAHIENPIPHIKLMAAFDSEGILITNTLMSFELDAKINPKFWLAYMNATFTSWYTYNFIYARAIRTMDFYNFYIQQIPLPKKILVNDNQQSCIQLVDQIISITKDDDYSDNPDKRAKVKKLEKEIDQLVYKLYELTPDEIKIVEGFGGK